MKTLHLHLALFVCSLFTATAQTPSVEWVKTWGSAHSEVVYHSVVDTYGSIVSVGRFVDSCDFDPDPTTQWSLGTAPNRHRSFVQKLDVDGNFLWACALDTAVDNWVRRVACDANGNIYIAGMAVGCDSLDLDPDPAKSYYVKGDSTGRLMFLLKLDPSGNLVWAKGHAGWVDVRGLEVSPAGEVYATGYFTGTIDKDPDPSVYDPVTNSTAFPQVFVEKLKGGGQQEWLHVLAGTDDIYANALALTDAEDVIVGGHFKGTVDFDPGPGVANKINSHTEEQAFFLRLDKRGSYEKTLVFDGNARSTVSDIHGSVDGKLYVAGIYDGNIDCDPTSTGHLYPANPTDAGYYLVKLDTSGAVNWGRFSVNDPVINPIAKWVIYLAESAAHEILMAGGFVGTSMILQTGTHTVSLPGHASSNGPAFTSYDADIFLAKYDSAGTLLYSKSWGHGYDDRASGVGNTSDEKTVVIGSFGYHSLPGFHPRGQQDVFVLKLDTCPELQHSIRSISVEACGQYELKPGYWVNRSINTYDTLQSARGCDSVYRRLNVTVHPMPLGVTQMPTFLHWARKHDQDLRRVIDVYWYDCDADSMVTVNSSTDFYPSKPGNYAMVLYNTQGQCWDTSACYSVNQIGLPENSPGSEVSLYPNPTTGKVRVQGLGEVPESIGLFTITGQQLKQVHNQNEINISTLPAGSYLLKINASGGVTVKKLIKQ